MLGLVCRHNPNGPALHRRNSGEMQGVGAKPGARCRGMIVALASLDHISGQYTVLAPLAVRELVSVLDTQDRLREPPPVLHSSSLDSDGGNPVLSAISMSAYSLVVIGVLIRGHRRLDGSPSTLGSKVTSSCSRPAEHGNHHPRSRKITRFQSQATRQARVIARAGAAWRLKDGTMVYVPADARSGAGRGSDARFLLAVGGGAEVSCAGAGPTCGRTHRCAEHLAGFAGAGGSIGGCGA